MLIDHCLTVVCESVLTWCLRNTLVYDVHIVCIDVRTVGCFNVPPSHSKVLTPSFIMTKFFIKISFYRAVITPGTWGTLFFWVSPINFFWYVYSSRSTVYVYIPSITSIFYKSWKIQQMGFKYNKTEYWQLSTWWLLRLLMDRS